MLPPHSVKPQHWKFLVIWKHHLHSWRTRKTCLSKRMHVHRSYAYNLIISTCTSHIQTLYVHAIHPAYLPRFIPPAALASHELVSGGAVITFPHPQLEHSSHSLPRYVITPSCFWLSRARSRHDSPFWSWRRHKLKQQVKLRTNRAHYDKV